MTALGEMIVSLVLSDAPTIALIGNRLYPSKITEGEAQPSVSFFIVNTTSVYAQGTSATFFRSRVQFDCWGISASSASGVASALMTLMNGYNGTVLSKRIWSILLEDRFTTYEQDAELCRESMDFIFTYTL